MARYQWGYVVKHIVQFVVCRLFVLGEITTGCGPSIPSLRGKYAVGINSSITECFFFFFFSVGKQYSY